MGSAFKQPQYPFAVQTAAEEASCSRQDGEEEMQIRWALHTGQLQLAPAAADLVQGLASLPLQLAGWEAPEQRWPLAEEKKPHLDSGMGPTLDYMLESQRFAQGGFGEVWRAELRRDREGASLPHCMSANMLYGSHALCFSAC